MKENSFYLIKDSYIDKVSKLGGKYQDKKERPIYCCIEDSLIKNLYWAIPTSDVSHRTEAQMQKITRYCSLPSKDIRSSFYHIGKTNRPAIFRISNALPITDCYIEKEYISQGVHLCIKDSEQQAAIRKKLLKILSYENQFPNRLEQHITEIKAHLVKELSLTVPVQPKPSIQDRLAAAKETVAQREADRRKAPQIPPPHKSGPER